MSGLPLLAPRDLDAPLAWRAGAPVSARQFLADAAAQAEVLSGPAPLVNLCGERYPFAVGFAAALLRGGTSLFPPNAMADTLSRLQAVYPSLLVLRDQASTPAGALPTVPLVAPAALPQKTQVPRIDAGLIAACLLTSGSTGAPQPHGKAWGTLVRNVEAAAARLAEGVGRADLQGLNIVATVPPQHSYGFESSVLLALLGGAAFDGGRPFYPADVAQALARLPRPRALVTTPFHLKTLLRSGVALPPVDLVLSATAPLSPQLAQAAERTFGGPLIEIYGCTEAGQVASRRTAESDLWETFGELRLQAEPAPADAGGECFVVQGGHVAEPTPLADVLQLQDARRFRLLGRANDLIHVAGKRSSLAHLNYHLNSIEGVEDGAFWLPEDVTDGVVRTVAFVVAPALASEQILAALRQRIDPVFLPRRLVRVASLPREGTGKLTAQSLAALAAEHLRDRA